MKNNDELIVRLTLFKGAIALSILFYAGLFGWLNVSLYVWFSAELKFSHALLTSAIVVCISSLVFAKLVVKNLLNFLSDLNSEKET